MKPFLAMAVFGLVAVLWAPEAEAQHCVPRALAERCVSHKTGKIVEWGRSPTGFYRGCHTAANANTDLAVQIDQHLGSQYECTRWHSCHYASVHWAKAANANCPPIHSHKR